MIRTYPARLVRVIDGDTFVVRLDLGMSVYADHTIRLHGIDAPERSDDDRWADARFRAGALMTFVGSKITDWPLLVSTSQTPAGTDMREKYGRLLARITLADGRDLATVLLQEGHALPWTGQGKHPVFT